MGSLGVVPAEDFEAQCGAKNTNDGINDQSDNRDLQAPRPRQLRQASVVMDAHFAFVG